MVALGAAFIVALLWVIPVNGQTIGARFFASLRLAKPKAETAGAGLSAPLNAGRRLQDVLAGIVAESEVAAHDEPNVPAETPEIAAKSAGFQPRLLRARNDRATITLLGEQRVDASVGADQLRTLLVQAGNRGVAVPRTIDKAPVSFVAARGVRVQYGNCPAPVANTIQGQIQGAPPPSPDNGTCVAVNEVPVATVNVPAALDTAAVMELALELAGMSPNQARDFRRLFPWPAAAVLSPPRGIRSYEMVRVGDADGMLVMTGGRRGPTYALVWAKDGMTYTLTGYGSSADAVPLAKSLE
ncbi:MAG: hypothetical protein ACREPM_25150 [Gemmatimonadaceae bacterium]